MLHFILGRAGTGKTRLVYDTIAHLPAQAQPVLLVPEQYSFESERTMLTLPEEKRAEVLSFSRLCDRVFKLYGGVARTPLSEGEKLLLMTRALEACTHQLQLYRRHSKSAAFSRQMLGIVTECKYSGITPELLTNAARQLPEGLLKTKTEEIALIMAAYAALTADSYSDPEDDVNRLYDELCRHPFFQGKTVFIDSFKGFTAPQKKIIQHIIGNAEDVTVTLCVNQLQQEHNLSLFANIQQLAGELIRMASSQNIKVAAPVVLTENHRAQTQSLAAMEAALAGEEGLYQKNCNDITICSCDSKYDEADFTAGCICRLVREEDFRYRDITVIVRNPADYQNILEGAFDRYNIPYFADRRRNILHQPLAVFALQAMKIGASGFGTEDILSLLKTGMTDLQPLEIAALENYAYVWNLRGPDWLRPFDRHPEGAGSSPTDEEAVIKLNRLRTRVTEPLQIFQNACKQGRTAKDYSKALYEFLTHFQVDAQLTFLARRLQTAGNGFEGEDMLRSYPLFMQALDHTVSALQDTPLTPAEFAQLLELTLSATDMGKIPQGLDQVTIGAADRTRPAAPKVVFVLGANEGSFPGVPAGGGLFSDRDRLQLNQIDIPLSDHLEFDTVEEQFLFYTAACCASHRVYFTCLTASGTQALSPCTPLLRLAEKLPGCRQFSFQEYCKSEDPLMKAQALSPAFDLLSQRYYEEDSVTGSLIDYFETHQPEKLLQLTRLSSPVDCKLTPDHAKELFGRDIFISPSGVEVYHQCRFFYFCRYGLRIAPRRPVALDMLSKGTLVHYVLEHMLKKYGSKGLWELSDNKLQTAVHTLLITYIEEEMGGLADKSPVFRFQLERIETLLLSLIAGMAEELKDSRFETAACELAIGTGNDSVPPLTIPLPEGGTLSVVGIVDRLDVYEQDGITYFRVMDYKTGVKKFALDDIYYGIGLQMLIYLYAVEQNGSRFGQNRIPAGILYIPARRSSVNAKDEDLEKELSKTMQMSGLVADTPAVIDAMDPGHTGLYMPFSFKKDGTPAASNALADLAFFGKTRKKIEQLLADMGASLAKGDITCDPLDPSKTEGDACHYCDYKAVCPAGGEGVHRKVPKLTTAQTKQLLKGGDPSAL